MSTARLRRGRAALLATPLIAALALAGCSASGSSSDSTTSAASSTAASSASSSAAVDPAGTHPVVDVYRTVEVPNNPQRVVAADSTIFQTLEDWNIKLVAAPKAIASAHAALQKDDSVIDLGNHKEPKLEELLAADPDLVLAGGRFQGKYEEVRDLLPEVAVVNTSQSELAPTEQKYEQLVKQTRLLGEVFFKQAEADALVKDLDAAIARVKAAYDQNQTVMGLLTTGGDINYSAPVTGRGAGQIISLAGLTPALEIVGSTDHQGDDISVETIAAANPEWIIVMDRDAALKDASDPSFKAAKELIAESPALQNVPAVQNNHILYLDADFYRTEGIQAYTQALNSLADALEQAK